MKDWYSRHFITSWAEFRMLFDKQLWADFIKDFKHYYSPAQIAKRLDKITERLK